MKIEFPLRLSLDFFIFPWDSKSFCVFYQIKMHFSLLKRVSIILQLKNVPKIGGGADSMFFRRAAGFPAPAPPPAAGVAGFPPVPPTPTAGATTPGAAQARPPGLPAAPPPPGAAGAADPLRGHPPIPPSSLASSTPSAGPPASAGAAGSQRVLTSHKFKSF